ncbi:UDP-N-acetylmuramyl pentapeptide phosphotransferase/UDP-N-acetylglucosamine-1-phosphate transferase [Myroides marinus]|uniref:UDP-N-acetylmuramyl pentapeptide phosphotransferase/UDP-N-acetylglucosamine-1-phosphate transferase n=1 Tax=Myroides marinus TaxID=703342 RepID=A0A1H6XR40_9FLAO|nr:glycosyltransferase family 4 protein [Myroides marinus]SEJ29237.1 UDP-N-acetylmuramyl pentapeptide phosphotransferase/UDP-N-acetylglucosamine-1-phosphate transferase [Myroides marinus]
MEYSIVLAVLFIAELVYFKIADKYNIIDKPNERSSHTQVTLRGGGVVFYFGALAYFIYSGFEYPYFIIGLTAITLISFLDDIFTLSNKIRLLVHLGSVLLMFYQWNLFELSWLWIVPALIGVIGTINAYNFMDGINGITAWYSIVILALLALVNQSVDFVAMDLILFALLGAVVFAFFNFRTKAKAFAGDVGSVSMAFIVVFLLGQLIITTGNFSYILFLTVYGIDAVWTIVRRALNKENIFQAHRTHLYQYLANEAKVNKLYVSFGYGVLQFIIGYAAILMTSQEMCTQVAFAVGVLVVMSVVYLVVKKKVIERYVF